MLINIPIRTRYFEKPGHDSFLDAAGTHEIHAPAETQAAMINFQDDFAGFANDGDELIGHFENLLDPIKKIVAPTNRKEIRSVLGLSSSRPTAATMAGAPSWMRTLCR